MSAWHFVRAPRAVARREVVACGGTVNSLTCCRFPALARLNTPIDRHELVHHPASANLQDHYIVRVSHREARSAPISWRTAHAWPARPCGLSFRDAARSPCTTTAQVFCRSREGLASPDLQLLFTPASYDRATLLMLERAPGATGHRSAETKTAVAPSAAARRSAREAGDPAELPVRP